MARCNLFLNRQFADRFAGWSHFCSAQKTGSLFATALRTLHRHGSYSLDFCRARTGGLVSALVGRLKAGVAASRLNPDIALCGAARDRSGPELSWLQPWEQLGAEHKGRADRAL